MSAFIHLKTIPEIVKFFNLNDPLRHPLIAVVDFSKVKGHVTDPVSVSADFYCMMFKAYCNNHVLYGRKTVDFQDGSLICMAPNQVIELDTDSEAMDNKGWGLFFHPDLIRATPLHDKMNEYNFFSYEISEALHLSEKEKQILYDCVLKIETELEENIDIHSENIVVSTIELLLNYCSRFYGRQFITRRNSDKGIVAQIERILTDYFKGSSLSEKGLPTVKYLGAQVNLSPGYLSDLLRKETGKNAQEHIHFYLIEEAKNILIGTNNTVGEIAYALGFEYPQYFSKLFKQKTGKTPIEFRQMN